MKRAIITVYARAWLTPEEVGFFLPRSYSARWSKAGSDPIILIEGEDRDRYTLRDYVIPELALEFIWAKEITDATVALGGGGG